MDRYNIRTYSSDSNNNILNIINQPASQPASHPSVQVILNETSLSPHSHIHPHSLSCQNKPCRAVCHPSEYVRRQCRSFHLLLCDFQITRTIQTVIYHVDTLQYNNVSRKGILESWLIYAVVILMLITWYTINDPQSLPYHIVRTYMPYITYSPYYIWHGKPWRWRHGGSESLPNFISPFLYPICKHSASIQVPLRDNLDYYEIDGWMDGWMDDGWWSGIEQLWFGRLSTIRRDQVDWVNHDVRRCWTFFTWLDKCHDLSLMTREHCTWSQPQIK